MAYKAPDYPPPTYTQPQQEGYPQQEIGQDPRAMQGYYGSPPPNNYYGSPYPPQQGPYPPPGPYGYQQGPQPMYYQQQPPMGYYDQRGMGSGAGGGICAGILGAMACCCCLDMLLI